MLALDVSSLDEAVELARRLQPVVLGRQGRPGAVLRRRTRWRSTRSLDEGFRVFLDLKLHDIPTTVARAARRIGSLGVSYATVHAAGGEEMLRAAVEGFEEGWATAVDSGHPEPAAGSAGILAVTVLTSDPDAGAELVGARASLAARTGCLGVICAAADLAVVARAPELITVVPGIRLAGSSQRRPGPGGRPFRQPSGPEPTSS